MGYTLEAIIGSPSVLGSEVERLPGAVLVPLAQGLAMVPMTDGLFDAVTDGTSDRPLGFGMPGGFDRMLATWSSAGPVGYVEADFFGGVGSQRAALWAGGQLVLGPLSVDVSQPSFGDAGSPISQVLRHLGVVRAKYRDEFEAVGLGRRRETADWLPRTRGQKPARGGG